MIKLELHPSVFNDIKGAKLWYSEKSEGLGERFLQELDHGMECIRAYPESWPKYISDTRRFFLHRFPFAIIYKYDNKAIKVYAVMHLRRKPVFWMDRYQ